MHFDSEKSKFINGCKSKKIVMMVMMKNIIKKLNKNKKNNNNDKYCDNENDLKCEQYNHGGHH